MIVLLCALIMVAHSQLMFSDRVSLQERQDSSSIAADNFAEFLCAFIL